MHNVLNKEFDITAISKDGTVNESNVNESKHNFYSATESEEYVAILDNYKFKQ